MAKKDKDGKKKGARKAGKRSSPTIAPEPVGPGIEPPASAPVSFAVVMPGDALPPEARPPYDLASEMADCASAVEHALNVILGGVPGVPDRLLRAMRHAVLGAGKRLRPLLLRQSADIFGESPLRSRAAQVAIEMVHCYSLVHDDLPSMDDDDLRRGRPTVHRAFDEATAILAGDALLTLAFEWLATSATADPEVGGRLVAELAEAAGAGGMVGGQMRDIEGETGGQASLEEIALTQSMKTGRLIRAAVRMGAILGGAAEDELAAITRYGELAGAAFQLGDDLLDATSTTEALGKRAGKDAGSGKQTLVARIGVEAARRRLADLVHDAINELSRFGPEADGLRASALYIAARER